MSAQIEKVENTNASKAFRSELKEIRESFPIPVPYTEEQENNEIEQDYDLFINGAHYQNSDLIQIEDDYGQLNPTTGEIEIICDLATYESALEEAKESTSAFRPR